MDPLSPTPALRVQVAVVTDVGRVRVRNEDAAAADPLAGLVVVADGMGGHPAGHRASALAVKEVLDGLTSPPGDGDSALRVEGAIRAAHRRVLREGDRDPACRGMGTTLTVLVADSLRRRWVVGHVGDSRAYLLRDGDFRQLTRDQTWVQERVDRGELSPEGAATHPLASLLLQAVGNGEEVFPEVIEGPLLPGDLFLLCTDGLIRVLSHEDMERMAVSRVTDGDGGLEAMAGALVEAANDGGAPDNVTVAVLSVASPT